MKQGTCLIRLNFFTSELLCQNPLFFPDLIFSCLFFNITESHRWKSLSAICFSLIIYYQNCTIHIQIFNFFWRFRKIFLTFFSQNAILYSSIKGTFEYWRKMWNTNHGESEVCGSRPSGQYLKISDTGLFLSRKNSLTVVFTCKTDSLSDTSFNEISYWSEQ